MNEELVVDVSGIEYYRDEEETGVRKRLPKKMTVHVDKDAFDCFADGDDWATVYDTDDAREFIGDLIEEKTGTPVADFRFAVRF